MRHVLLFGRVTVGLLAGFCLVAICFSVQPVDSSTG